MVKVGDYVESIDGCAVPGFVFAVLTVAEEREARGLPPRPGDDTEHVVMWRGDDGVLHLSQESYVKKWYRPAFRPVRRRRKPTVSG